MEEDRCAIGVDDDRGPSLAPISASSLFVGSGTSGPPHVDVGAVPARGGPPSFA
jgi:hypothetical protein